MGDIRSSPSVLEENGTLADEASAKNEVGILGGGLTGLTLGYLLNRRAGNHLVLERDHECGGLIRTARTDGYSFDVGGSHILFSKDAEALGFMLELLGDNKVKGRRNAKILYKGRLVKYPFENGLASLPIQDNFECLYDFVHNYVARSKGESANPSSLREWFCHYFGRSIAEKYLVPYNEKTWKYPLDQIGLDWVRRVPHITLEEIVKSSLGFEIEGYTHQLQFDYPRVGGIQALAAALEEGIRPNIIKDYQVRSIDKEDDCWVVSSGNRELVFDRLVSTIHLKTLVHCLRGAPRDIIDAASRLRSNSLITVGIGVNRPRLCDLSWLYVPDPDIMAHRISFPSNYSPCVAPEGHSAVLAEITCDRDDEIWNMSDGEIIETTISDLEKIGLVNQSDVDLASLNRVEHAYVINDIEYAENVGRVKEYVCGQGIDLIGRFSEFAYLNMDACVRNAMNYVKAARPT